MRREKNKLRRYAHLGTGNYNPSTAKTYTDYSLFTSKSAFTADLANLFNTLTGYTRKPNFRKILVAPYSLLHEVIRLIGEEIKAAKSGKEARVIIKVNSLIDPECIDELYKASQAGVKVDLIVRGICGLVPGVKGLSENIRVKSLLGRFLEHSRVFHFQNAPIGNRTYLGSPDWMPRNFFRRVEVAFPVEQVEEEKKILDTMQAFIDDNAFATELKSSGKYNPASKRKKIFSVQENLIESTKVEIAKQMEASLRRRTSGKTKDQSEGDQENSNPIIGSLDIQVKCQLHKELERVVVSSQISSIVLFLLYPERNFQYRIEPTSRRRTENPASLSNLQHQSVELWIS